MRVFENRVLRKIFGPKREDVTEKCRKLRNVELHNRYSSPHILVMKSRKMRWVGHLAHIGRGEVHTGFWCGNLKERDHLKDLDLDGRIILKWIFKN